MESFRASRIALPPALPTPTVTPAVSLEWDHSSGELRFKLLEIFYQFMLSGDSNLSSIRSFHIDLYFFSFIFLDLLNIMMRDPPDSTLEWDHSSGELWF